MYISLIPLCCLYCMSSSIFLFDILRTYRLNNSISMKLCCKSMFLFIEGIIPLIVFYTKVRYDKRYSDIFLIDYSTDGINALYVMWLFSVIGYFSICLACDMKNYINFSIRNSCPKFKKYNDNLLLPTTIITLCIGIVSMHLWTKAFGGIQEFIMQADLIRAGRSNIPNRFAFLLHTSRCVITSSYALFIILKYRRSNKTIVRVLWIVATVYSILFLLCTDGRLAAGFYFLTYAIIKVKIGGKRYNTKKIIISAISIILVITFIMKMDDITYFIRSGVWNGASSKNEISSSFIGELMYIYNSTQYVIMNHKTIPLQIFNDLGYGLFAWLPTKFKPSVFLRIWKINTDLINLLVNGEIPFGIIAQGYYDLRILGVFILPYIYGRIIKRVDLMNTDSAFGSTLFAAIFYIMLRVVAYGMIYDFVLALFNVVIFYCIYRFLNGIFSYKSINSKNQCLYDRIKTKEQ